MTIIRVRLCDRDRAVYGRDGEDLPAELVLDLEALKDLTAIELERVDLAMRAPVAAFMGPLESGSLAVAQVRWAAAWLALRLNGYDVPIGDFQPMLLRGAFTREVVDGPPDGTSESSSEDTVSASSSPL